MFRTFPSLEIPISEWKEFSVHMGTLYILIELWQEHLYSLRLHVVNVVGCCVGVSPLLLMHVLETSAWVTYPQEFNNEVFFCFCFIAFKLPLSNCSQRRQTFCLLITCNLWHPLWPVNQFTANKWHLHAC